MNSGKLRSMIDKIALDDRNSLRNVRKGEFINLMYAIAQEIDKKKDNPLWWKQLD